MVVGSVDLTTLRFRGTYVDDDSMLCLTAAGSSHAGCLERASKHYRQNVNSILWEPSARKIWRSVGYIRMKKTPGRRWYFAQLRLSFLAAVPHSN